MLTDEQYQAVKYARSVMSSVPWETSDAIHAKHILDVLLAAHSAASQEAATHEPGCPAINDPDWPNGHCDCKADMKDGVSFGILEDEAERIEFMTACQDFEDDGETPVCYRLLMKWANEGLLECRYFTVTEFGSEALSEIERIDRAKGE